MNVFWHELAIRRKVLLGWMVAMVVFVLTSMAKYQAVAASGSAAIQQMFATFPRTVQAVFGMNGLDLTTVAGYFGVCFLFIVVILAVHAGLTGISVLAEEEQDKTTEFLYVKPRSRRAIITAKLLAGMTMLIAVWAATAIGSLAGIMKFAQMGDFAHDFWLMMAAAALIQLVFFGLGTAAVAMSTHAALYGRIVAIAIFGSYLLSVLAKLSDRFSWVQYGSIFSYFDAADIVHTHRLKLHYVVLCAALSILLLVATLIGYARRDLRI